MYGDIAFGDTYYIELRNFFTAGLVLDGFATVIAPGTTNEPPTDAPLAETACALELADGGHLETRVFVELDPIADIQVLSPVNRGATGIQQLNLQLVNREDASQQRLASVYVTGRARPPASSPTLLSDIALRPQSRNCGLSPCSEVAFELLEPAYLLVFRTHQAELTPVVCRSRVPFKQQGEHRYRLQLSRNHEQRVGLYVIASRERGQLDALHRQLREAPGACGSPPGRNHQRWLETALSAVTEGQHTLQWRAIHLINSPQGAIEL